MYYCDILMLIEFNPRISGKFVEHVLRNKIVSAVVPDGLTDRQKHDFAKAVLISAFGCFEVNINDIINNAKSGD